MSAVLLIPAAVDQGHLRPEQLQTVPAGVLAALGQVIDPRRRRGVRHGCTAVLAIAVCAVLAGARSYVGIAGGTATDEPGQIGADLLARLCSPHRRAMFARVAVAWMNGSPAWMLPCTRSRG